MLGIQPHLKIADGFTFNVILLGNTPYSKIYLAYIWSIKYNKMKNHTAQDIALSVLSEPHMPLPNYIFSLLPEEHLFPDSPVPCI